MSLAPATLLRAPDVCKYIGISRPTLYRLLDRGGFPKPFKIGMRAVAWRASEVEAWFESRRTKGA